MRKGLYILIPLLLFLGLPSDVAGKEERSWQDESIYYITIDRFNNSDFTNDHDVDANDPSKYHGGDFQGILDRLDYIKDMGFTVLGLSSIFENEENGYHGYWIKDYQRIEENFGTVEKLKELVKEAHQRDMKVVIDFPILDGVPQETLIDAGKWWMNESKIDGYRIDAAKEVPSEFLQDFSKEMKSTKDDFLILEDIRTNIDDEKAGVDGYFDYLLSEELRKAYSQPNQSLQSVMDKMNPTNDLLRVQFLDNQHTHRFTRDAVNLNEHPGPRWKMALTYLYTTPGIPFVFYGSEIAVDGGEEPDNLRQMDFRTDKELVDYITSIAKIRDQLPSLRKGSFELLHEDQGMLVYKREYKGETAVVAINNTTKSQSATLSTEFEDNKELRGLLNGDLVRSEDGKYKIIIDRDEAEIYILADKTGINIPVISASAAVVILFIVFLFLLKRKSRKS